MRIDTKALLIVIGKDDKIKEKIRKTLNEEGKFHLYANLAGAKRPLTEITKCLRGFRRWRGSRK